MKKMLFCAIAFVAMSGAAMAAETETTSISNLEIVNDFALKSDVNIVDLFLTGFKYQIYDAKGNLQAEGSYNCNGSALCASEFAVWLFNATPKGGKATSTAF